MNETVEKNLLAAVRAAARQEQFLEIVSAEEARARFAKHVTHEPLAGEPVLLGSSLGRVLSEDVIAPVDSPPFDRSGVDGFAVRAADTTSASESTPRRLVLNAEVIACGHAPTLEVKPGTATTIATGGVIPRGADAVVMVENTELADSDAAIEIRRAVVPGAMVGYCGSDIARGETLLRRGTRIGSREIGMLAACGLASIDVVRRPKIAVLSTGDELVQPGEKLRPASIYDSNGAIVAAAVTEAGGEALPIGTFPDEPLVLEKALRAALSQADMVILSGGTSKGVGDLSHRIVSKLGKPGVIVHGVALKPGKPLCLAVIGNKPVVVLPGFPTSAIFTFHAFVASLIRSWAGLPPEATQTVEARVPLRIPSELGRQEFMLVSLVEGDGGKLALPTAKGSGAVTSFSQADGFIAVDALVSSIEAGSTQQVTLIGGAASVPDLIITGSHDIALDIVVGALADRGFTARTIAIGSQGGAASAARGECDFAPVHLIDPREGPTQGKYNVHLVTPGLALIPGWRRMQGVVYRRGDKRFDGKKVKDAVTTALADTSCMMVNRNAGSGTRMLIDTLLKGTRPPGYANQPKSHNAVAAAVIQGRADWGVAISPVANLYGLGFLPLAPEHYDFLLVESRRNRPPVQAFLSVLRDENVRARIRTLGMELEDTKI
jgi:putative molybdopterin biosynthesis protein